MTQISPENPRRLFSFVSGRHHGPECWDHVRDEVSRYGWLSVAPDLPIENVRFTLNDHARVLVEAERAINADEIWRVGWSWGANVIPRETSRTPVRGLLYLAGAFHQSTLWSRFHGRAPVPEHSVAYSAMEQTDSPIARQESAAYVFYDREVEEPTRADSVAGLRYHPRRRNEPKLEPYPWHLPAEYVYFSEDKALLASYQLKIAEKIGLTPVRFESGHAPMISESRARRLARLLISLADQDRPS